MYRFLAILSIFATITTCISTANAQPEKTILVLDASGSMWGQIDGEPKITIAKRAVGVLLDDLPDDAELGLTAYGHRQKGQCGDIETLVQPGLNTKDAIRAAVDAINPKGKTPLSDAVLQAAETLKYEEDAATVILVSDGIETCDRDPCAVGRTLEQAGIQFTAHVIGFDIEADGDRAQLACLAEETGGQFLVASNAAELIEALEQVAEAPPPLPEAVDTEFVATLGDGGPLISDGLTWTLEPRDDGGTTLDAFEIGQLRMAVRPGVYTAVVHRPATDDSASATVRVSADGHDRFVLVLPDPTPKATLSAPQVGPVGATILVDWTGPAGTNDRITMANADDTAGNAITYAYVKDGTPLPLRVAPLAGTYQIRYVTGDNQIIATQAITATPINVTLDAPAQAVASTTIKVGWDGPDYHNDRITITKSDAPASAAINYAYVKDDNPTDLAMPVEPGTYEIRYVMALGNTILGRRTIDITDVSASVAGPETASGGTLITVTWDGPDNKNDHISLAEAGAAGGSSLAYEYTKNGSPVRFIVPGKPGNYEIRYIISQGNEIAATYPIRVTEAIATVAAAETAEIGGVTSVNWTGPDNRNDYIAISTPGDRASTQIAYTYTNKGNPLQLAMPSEPGTYEIRYVLNKYATVLASTTITVEASAASISAPETGDAGSPLVVEWTGPDNNNDYIAVAEIGSEDSQYVGYEYTKKGTPLTVTLPATPGEYELRYVLSTGNKAIARRAVTVAAATAAVSAPDTAEAGTVIAVEWTGPDNDNDYITVAEAGAPDGEYILYEYTKAGSPVQLQLPGHAGAYEVRYILAEGNTVIARKPLTLTATTATLVAPETVEAGAPINVEWTGPNTERDYIVIAEIDAADTDYAGYTYTNEGTPLLITAPGKSGAYELRYILDQGRTVLARIPVTITEANILLEASDTTSVGANLVVNWTGPGYQRDHITIAEQGAADGTYTAYEYTTEGSPLILKMPDVPGTYELRYILGSDNSVMARRTVTVE